MNDSKILTRLRTLDIARLRQSAQVAQMLEDKWAMVVASEIERCIEKSLENLENYLPPEVPDLETLFIEQTFEVAIRAMYIAHSHSETDNSIKGQRLGKRLPKLKIPTSFSELMRLYDLWRHGRFKPSRPAQSAKDVKDLYLKKVSSVWERYSKEFREGDVYTQLEVKQKIRDAARTTVSRAKIIARTETTNYYNQARREYYDGSPDVTHYLFLAVRDKATTRWCSPKTIDGYRGRHGLVYRKTDPLTAKETPACHWNCRSEFLPLTPDNPSHLKLIEDKTIQRATVRCYPLPKGWRTA